MKKKFVVCIAIVVLLVAFCFVACNKTDDSVEQKTKFTSDMTREEIFKTIDGLKNLTCLYGHSKEMIGEKFCVFSTGGYSTYQFAEGNRYYRYSVDGSSKSACEIVDYSGFDTADFKRFSALSDKKEELKKLIIENGYLVDNGNLRIFTKNSTGSVVVMKCNETHLNVPDSFKDYKTRESSAYDVVSYRLSASGKEYEIVVDRPFNYVIGLEIAKSHEGLPIRIDLNSVKNLEKVVLPENIIVGYVDLQGFNGKLSVEYRGTKAQWAEIDNVAKWSSLSGKVKVTCSDGEYTK